jgi:hypothetical protein
LLSIYHNFCYRLSKAKREIGKKIANTSPGVGRYNDQSPTIKKRNPSYRMSLKTESDFEKILRKECSSRPGPGNYDPFRTSLTNISYSICGKNSKEEIHTKNLTKKMRQSIDAVNK